MRANMDLSATIMASDKSILKVIEFSHPEIVQDARVATKPQLTDASKINHIAEAFNLRDHDSRLHFIACVIRLYDPAVLVSEKHLKRGIAPKIAEVLQCTRQNVSHHADTARWFYRFYNEFQQVVDQKFQELIENQT